MWLNTILKEVSLQWEVQWHTTRTMPGSFASLFMKDWVVWKCGGTN